MAIAGLVFQKLLVLFLLMLAGLFLAQRQILTKEVTLQLSKLLTRFVAPSLLQLAVKKLFSLFQDSL